LDKLATNTIKFTYLQRHFFVRTSNLKANIHIVPFQFVTVKNSYFKICKVVWRRYLGKVGKIYWALWLIYPRHCTSISIKIGQVL